MAKSKAQTARWGAWIRLDQSWPRLILKSILGFFRPPYLYTVIYMLLYLAGFLFIEQVHPESYFLIHSPIDDLIPFCEVFAVPYLMWFLYWVPALIFFGIHRMILGDNGDFALLSWALAIAMTSFIIISLVFPNELQLRPDTLERDNVFTWMCTMIWERDTPTNVIPSIHVFNSIATHVAICRCSTLRPYRPIRISSGIMCFLIIIATMFIKQHSIVDVIAGIVAYVVVYLLVYRSPLRDKIARQPEKPSLKRFA